MRLSMGRFLILQSSPITSKPPPEGHVYVLHHKRANLHTNEVVVILMRVPYHATLCFIHIIMHHPKPLDRDDHIIKHLLHGGEHLHLPDQQPFQ